MKKPESTNPGRSKQTIARRRVILGTVLAIVIALAFYGLFFFRVPIGVISLGLVIGTVTRPAFTRLEAAGLRGDLAIAGLYILLLVALVGLRALGIPSLLDQADDLVSRAQEFYQTIRQSLALSHNLLLASLSHGLPESIGPSPQGQAPQEQVSPPSEGSSADGARALRPLGLLGQLARVVIMAAGALLIGFYWSLN